MRPDIGCISIHPKNPPKWFRTRGRRGTDENSFTRSTSILTSITWRDQGQVKSALGQRDGENRKNIRSLASRMHNVGGRDDASRLWVRVTRCFLTRVFMEMLIQTSFSSNDTGVLSSRKFHRGRTVHCSFCVPARRLHVTFCMLDSECVAGAFRGSVFASQDGQGKVQIKIFLSGGQRS